MLKGASRQVTRARSCNLVTRARWFSRCVARSNTQSTEHKIQWDELVTDRSEGELKALPPFKAQRKSSSTNDKAQLISESVSQRGAEAIFQAIDDEKWPLIHKLSTNEPWMETNSFTEYLEDGTGRRLVRFLFTTRPPHIPSLETIMDHQRPPQSLWAHEGIGEALSQPWYRKKTYTVELCVTRLVLELCQASGLCDMSDEELARLPLSVQPFAALNARYAEYVARHIELELIAIQSIPSDNYPTDRKIELAVPLPSYPDKIGSATEELNKGLIRACSQKEPFDSAFIARICSHLIRSQGRPDINTINQLLLTFISRRRDDLVWPLQSLVYDGHFRPNELTCAAILRFYRQNDDHDRFMDYVVMMYGEKSGLMLAMPWKKTKDNLSRSQGRLLPKGEKLVQAVTPSSIVYLETIMGMVHFRGLRQSWRIFENLAGRGWGFDYTCMYVLLFQSAVAKAQDIFAQVWSEARRLASHGYLIPKRLYALAIAAHYLNYERRRSLDLLKEYLAREPLHEDEILVLIKQRLEMIKQTRKAEQDVPKEAWRRFEVDYNSAELPEELRLLD